jgi:hypothetical protein
MSGIEIFGYILLSLYGIYCLTFLVCVLVTLFRENKNQILRYLPFRKKGDDVQEIFEMITNHNTLDIIEE